MEKSPIVNNVLINGFEVDIKKRKDHRIFALNNSLFPEMVSVGGALRRNIGRSLNDISSSIDRLLPMMRQVIHGKTKDNTIKNFLAMILADKNFSKETIYRVANNQSAQSFHRFADDLKCGNNKEIYTEIYREFLYCRLIPLVNSASDVLRNVFDNLLYIGPARARSERYYRYQDLSVLEIDPNGNNFPMFLNSLSRELFNDFSTWVESLFGYGLQLSNTEGHISINIVERGREINVVDTGYGISQILPVLGQIWWAQRREGARNFGTRLKTRNTIVAIEQPELHLHPAHQSLLAEALIAYPYMQKDADSPEITLLVETHSETLINRIGELVAKRKINHEDVQIVIFEEDSSSQDETMVSIAEFEEDGSLSNWPYGFFQG